MAKDKGEQEALGTDVANQVGPGKAVGETSLSSAVGYLKSQNPQKWDDLGPHHNGPGRIARGGKLHESGSI